MNQNRETMREAIKKQIARLKEEAELMASAYWDYHKQENKKQKDFKDRSILEVTIKKQRNAFGIEWNRVTAWKKNKDEKWYKEKTYIPRSGKFRASLKKYSKPWEEDELKIFEDRAEMIRKELDTYSKFVAALNRMDKDEIT